MADYHTDNVVFLLYKDWESLFASLDSNEEAGELIKALFAFAKRGEIAEFSGALKMAFIFMSQQIERDGVKWEETCTRRAEYGRKGGMAKAEKQKAAKASLSQQELAKVADTDTETDTDTDTVTDTVRDISHIASKTRARFTPPTVEEVAEYCREKGYGVDAHRFVDFYTSKGWMVGRSPMKDWKAAVRNWAGSDKQRAKNDRRSSIDIDEVERSIRDYSWLPEAAE